MKYFYKHEWYGNGCIYSTKKVFNNISTANRSCLEIDTQLEHSAITHPYNKLERLFLFILVRMKEEYK